MNRLAWLAAVATAAVAVAVAAQEPPGGEPPPPAEGQPAGDDVPFLDELPEDAGRQEAEPAVQPEPAPPAGEQETLPPPPPSTGPTPQRFDPSEEVRADFPVSFPIDI